MQPKKYFVFLFCVGSFFSHLAIAATETSESLFPASSELSERWSSLMELQKQSKEKALPVLEKALQHSEWYMRNGALLVLEKIDRNKALAWSQKLLKDASLLVRSAAVDTIGKNLQPHLREKLWEQLQSKKNFRGPQSLWIRSQAISYLSEHPQKNELSLFQKFSNDSDLAVRNIAIKSVGLLRQKTISLQKLPLSSELR